MAPPANLQQLLETRIFPGMTIEESRLVRAWLAKHGAEWDTANAEAKIGRGVILPPTYGEKDRADWEKRTRARPDLVLTRVPGRVAIGEAKEQLTNEGIWQVLGYRDLWLADHPHDQVECFALAYAATSTAVQLAKARGVRVFLYDAPARPLPTDPATEVP